MLLKDHWHLLKSANLTGRANSGRLHAVGVGRKKRPPEGGLFVVRATVKASLQGSGFTDQKRSIRIASLAANALRALPNI